MKPSFIFIIIFIIYIHFIISQNVDYEYLTFDKAVKEINKINYSKIDYDKIIDNIKKLLIEKYIYLDIAKNPPSPYKSIDIIEELNLINTEGITYYEFYQKVFTIILKLKDPHLSFLFKPILEYEYIGPVYYIMEIINNKNYLYLRSINEEIFSESIINKIKENENSYIKSINGKDPFEYIRTFGGNQKLKSEHAQYNFNMNKYTVFGKFTTYPFKKDDLTNIEVEFQNGIKIYFDYKIYKVKKMNRELEEYYKKEIEKSKYDIIKPTIIEIEKKFNELKNKNRKLEQSIWDYNYDNKIKLKIDHENKVNVIYQNTLRFYEIVNGEKEFDYNAMNFHILMAQKINNNNYPIILIEDFNNGGYIDFAFLMLNVLNTGLSLNTFNYAFKPKEGEEIETDYYGYIKHKRRKIETMDFIINYWSKFSDLKINQRKPNDIIVFTDGLELGSASSLIKNLQEMGNAIIVGYNGIPSEEKKYDKFDASISPSIMTYDIGNKYINFFNEYNILVTLTVGETFNDSYINKDITPIPREYIINPIDERSNIYGEYNDFRYNEFINEGKRIFKKYKYECNINNKKMVLLSNECKFENKFQLGGFKCINSKWSNICQISNCIKPYTFNTETKECNIGSTIEDYLKKLENQAKEYKEQLKKDFQKEINEDRNNNDWIKNYEKIVKDEEKKRQEQRKKDDEIDKKKEKERREYENKIREENIKREIERNNEKLREQTDKNKINELEKKLKDTEQKLNELEKKNNSSNNTSILQIIFFFIFIFLLIIVIYFAYERYILKYNRNSGIGLETKLINPLYI
jgi:hypothetical protein